MLRPTLDQNPSPSKSRRRHRRERSEHIVPIPDQDSNTQVQNTNVLQPMPAQISNDLQPFQSSVSPRPVMELDQLNQRQLLLQALVASSKNGNNHQKQHLRQTPSPAASLSSTTSSSHGSSLDNFRDTAGRSYSN